jgi:hypothetical protein
MVAALMVAAWSILGLLVVLSIAAHYDTRRPAASSRRTMPAVASRTARRRIRREQRAKTRAAVARYTAGHPFQFQLFGGDGGGPVSLAQLPLRTVGL